jgi:hypothetical protein
MSAPQNAPKAARARELLQTCKSAALELRKDPTTSWFVLWAGTLGLLRTIGDLLKNDADNRIRKSQIGWFNQMKHENGAAGRGTDLKKDGNKWEPAIYWQFIRRDRNLLFHEAQSTVSQSANVPLVGVSATATAAGEEPRPIVRSPDPPRATYFYTMSTPPYAGRDARDVAEEAIQWWEEQIDKIEKDAI